MTHHYIFHIGRETELALAELEAVFGKQLEIHGNCVLMEWEEMENPEKVLNTLGGVIKISEVFWKVDENGHIPEKITEELLRIKPEGKLSFGLNIFPSNDKTLNAALRKIKQIMKSGGRNARFINKRGNLTSAMIVMGGILKSGTDINLVHTARHAYLSRTIAVQNFAAYSLRDYEKPGRLAKEGMLPPKLAQIMINLTGFVTHNVQFERKTIYDPFCGSGTILGEGLIKGMNVLASDLDMNAIAATEKNLDWLRHQNFGITHNQSQEIFQQDAATLDKRSLPESPDMIVSETFLGPPRVGLQSPDDIHNIYKRLLPLYREFFRSIHPLLNKGTPLVIAFPVYHSREGGIRIPNLKEEIEPLGYKLHRFFIYHRKQQIVGREIAVLERI